MRLIATEQCKPGMRLGKPIYSGDGQILVGYQVQLTDAMINRLAELGYEYLYIDDPNTDDIFIEDSIRMETRMAMRITLQRVYKELAQNSKQLFDGRLSIVNMCNDSLSMVLNDLKDPKTDTIMLINANPNQANRVEEHFIQNAINVCVFATSLGISQGYSSHEVNALSLAALLHDIGNLLLPPDILLKPSDLSHSEFETVKKHCELGCQLLKDEPGIPQSSLVAVLQHHERIDGSGYPFGLRGADLHPFARWIGLIDSYDAMTNPRPFRKAMLPHEAMERLYAHAGTLFDLEKVEMFRNKVAIFPVGLHVILSSGESGIVSKINPNCIQRPIVRVLKDAAGMELKQPFEIDLSQRLNIMIQRIGEQMAV